MATTRCDRLFPSLIRCAPRSAVETVSPPAIGHASSFHPKEVPYMIAPDPRLLSTAGALALATLATATAQGVPFQRVQIASTAGDVKLVGDIDLDGTADVVLGGMPTEGLSWFHYPSWRQTRIATPSVEFTTDGALGDVDGDGDLDVVVPDGPNGANLLWFENPMRQRIGPGGNPFAAAEWVRHAIGAIGWYGKDVELADFDGDGRLDVAARSNTRATVFFRDPGTWSAAVLATSALGDEGMASGDIDGDGDVDLVVRGVWLDNPGRAAARSASRWSEYGIDRSSAVHGSFKAAVADLDGNGRVEVLFSSSEGTADVAWYSHSGNPRAAWTRFVLVRSVEKAHTLQTGDIDGDGDIDVVVGQLHTSVNREIRLYRNDGAARSWTNQLIDQGSGIHNGVVADVGSDGDLDLVGANWTGNPPLRLWENLTPQPWQRLQVDRLVAGTSADVRVANATPGRRVLLCASLHGATAPYQVPSWATTFALVDPVAIGARSAGPNGVAQFLVGVPNITFDHGVAFQALEFGRSSHVVVTGMN
jgi:hypothetical protein